MKKNSTVAKNRNKIFKQPKRTIGLDLGDRSSHYCILDEAGNVILEHDLPTTPKGIQQVLALERYGRVSTFGLSQSIVRLLDNPFNWLTRYPMSCRVNTFYLHRLSLPDFNSIAPKALRRIKSQISLGDKSIKVGSLRSREARKPKTCSNRQAVAVEIEFRCLKFCANTLDYTLCVLLRRMRQHKKKFFASNTAANITASRFGFQNLRKRLEDGVARVVSMGIIDSLEMVQVSQRDPEGKAVPGRPAQLPCRPVFNCAPIWKAGQGIGEGKFLQHGILDFDFSLEFHNSEAHPDPSDEFFRMKRFSKVIVGSRCQPLNYTLLL
jgi:hypothetical protein